MKYELYIDFYFYGRKVNSLAPNAPKDYHTPVENTKSSRKKCRPKRLFDPTNRLSGGFKNVDLKMFRVRLSKKTAILCKKSTKMQQILLFFTIFP